MFIRLNEHVLASLFGDQAECYSDAIRMAIDVNHREFRQTNAGHRFNLAAFSNGVVAAEPVFNLEGSSRVSVSFYDCAAPDLNLPFAPGVPSLRLDLPTVILREKTKPSHWLYNIRFQLMEEDAKVDAQGMRPFRVGYFGITKRNVFERFKEHEAQVRKGTGHILHKAWRGLVSADLNFHPVIQISAMARSLDEVYAYEERAVAERSLSPMGLNAIPGGYAGIKMLHELALLSKVDGTAPEARDEALVKLERGGASKCTHYRSGHIRNLQNGKTTWVSPCWVNLTDEVAA